MLPARTIESNLVTGFGSLSRSSSCGLLKVGEFCHDAALQQVMFWRMGPAGPVPADHDWEVPFGNTHRQVTTHPSWRHKASRCQAPEGESASQTTDWVTGTASISRKLDPKPTESGPSKRDQRRSGGLWTSRASPTRIATRLSYPLNRPIGNSDSVFPTAIGAAWTQRHSVDFFWAVLNYIALCF